jgi:hypothetical protein
MKIHFVGKSLWFMQNNNGVKQRFLACFLKILDKKRKKRGELFADQYMYGKFCIKFPQSRMKGERHRLSPLSL